MTTVPLFGKFSDVYGRRTVYLVTVTLFAAGSIICAAAPSLNALVAGRAVQGIGALRVLCLLCSQSVVQVAVVCKAWR